jgi:pyrimidine-nucleoside phosphorylase
MSGRGLGHTGGTIDKLEAIPGLKTAFTKDEFINIVTKTGICVAGQSGNMAPADKKIYALRDVTGTVESLPLIASSIMSKKIAAGSDAILLDVKTGSGAFMKTLEDSITLAQEMVNIGEAAGRKTVALITDMDIPLGQNIGNSLEIIEVVKTLKGNGPEDLANVCKALAVEMLMLAGKGNASECAKMAEESIKSGKALDKFIEMVEAQGGDSSVIKNTDNFDRASLSKEVVAQQSGYIYKMDAEAIGLSSGMLGAGRDKEGAAIDYSAGIILERKTGDKVNKGDVIAYLYANDDKKLNLGYECFVESLEISDNSPKDSKLIYARVDIDGVTRL